MNSQIKYFPEKYSWHQSKAFPVSFQCHRLSTVIHRQWQESVKCCKQHADGAQWNSCCTNQSNWTYHEMLSRHGWPDSTETHFMALKSMGIPLFTSVTSHLIFAHERCVTSSEHEGTLAWTKAKPSSSRRSHQKTYLPVQVRIHIVFVELAIFVGKDSVPQNFSL